MKAVDIPSKFPIPFADSAGPGFINTIPETTATPGRASLTDGFPPINFDDPAAGGIPPFGGDFNGLFNIVTAWLQWSQAGGTVQYDAAFSADIGGYPKGSVLMSNPAAKFWLSTVDDNVTNPDAAGAGWIDPYGGFAPLASPAFTGIPTAPTATGGTNTTQISTTAFVAAAIAVLAPLASPALTGNPTAPTQSPGNNSTRLATTAFVAAAVAAVAAGVASFNGRTGVVTLNSSDVTTALGFTPAALASPTFTGTPAAPTASPGTNTTQIATTAFAAALGALKADLASPVFTGNPTAPTASPGTNTTQIATTAFMQAAIVALGSIVNSFNSRTGAVTLTSGDVTSALGFTPANINSPTFTGVPAAPTATLGTNTTQVATTAFVQQEISGGATNTGMVAFFAMQVAPTGWLFCDGSAVSRTTYAALFAQISTLYGAGDGSTTFNLPDAQGYFLRGWANQGIDFGRAFGSTQADEYRAHTHVMNGRSPPQPTNGALLTFTGTGTTSNQSGSTASSGGTETRPYNIAMYACIKT